MPKPHCRCLASTGVFLSLLFFSSPTPLSSCWLPLVFKLEQNRSFVPTPPVLPPAKPCHGTDGVRTTNPVMHGITESWTCHPTRPVPVDCFPRRRLRYGRRPSLSVSSPCVYNFILTPGRCCVTICSPLIGAVGSGSFRPYLEPAESPLRVRSSSSFSAPRSSCCAVIVWR